MRNPSYARRGLRHLATRSIAGWVAASAVSHIFRNRNHHALNEAMSGYPALAGDFVKMGARYVSTGTDLSFLLGAAIAKRSKCANSHAATAGPLVGHWRGS